MNKEELKKAIEALEKKWETHMKNPRGTDMPDMLLLTKLRLKWREEYGKK